MPAQPFLNSMNPATTPRPVPRQPAKPVVALLFRAPDFQPALWARAAGPARAASTAAAAAAAARREARPRRRSHSVIIGGSLPVRTPVVDGLFRRRARGGGYSDFFAAGGP